MLRRYLSAFLEQLPQVGTIFKHRDIDLWVKVRAICDKKIILQYGFYKNKQFTPIKGRALRDLTNFQLHLRYDEC